MIEFPLYKIHYGRHHVECEDPDILQELVMQILQHSDRIIIEEVRNNKIIYTLIDKEY